MRWRQFLTPVKSISAEEAKSMISESDDVTLLDVRQPGEYLEGHISGSKLLPIGDLGNRLRELNPESSHLVYCAVGGRSRVAAQMLAGNGFKNVINLTGGFKAWNGWKGYGDELQGLSLFRDTDSVKDLLEAAYIMEKALNIFYLSMMKKVSNPESVKIFKALATAEEKHSSQVREKYSDLTGGSKPPEPGKDDLPEGGLTTEEYMSHLGTRIENPREVVDFAMTLEAQALDLYSRAARRAGNQQAREALEKIAMEERGHLKQLASLMDSLV